jgi:SAM-dependent methyltransferase
MFHAGELRRYQCPSCDVIFGDLRFLNLPLSEIAADYKDLYSFYKEGNTTPYITHIIDKINLGKDKTYLDYACGESTSTLDTLNASGYNVYGYDAYVDNPHPKFIKTINETTTFDVVYSNNYIEHVINPQTDLLKLLALVNKNGKLVLIGPCWDYCIEYTHYHTFFFIDRSLQYLCNMLGIKEIYSEHIKFEDGDSTIVKIFEKL